MNGRIVLAGVVVGIAFVVTVGYALATRTDSEPDLGPVIARVNGTPIYLSQAETRIAGLATSHGDVEKALGSEWHRMVLDSLVDDVIVQAEADRRGLTIPDERAEGALGSIRSGFASPQEFDAWLDEQGMGLAELERRIHLNLLTAEVYLDLTASTQVTQAEIRDYYRKHKDDFASGDRTLPLLQVRDSIREQLEKQGKDRAYAQWLEQQREQVEVVVVLDDWWRGLG